MSMLKTFFKKDNKIDILSNISPNHNLQKFIRFQICKQFKCQFDYVMPYIIISTY